MEDPSAMILLLLLLYLIHDIAFPSLALTKAYDDGVVAGRNTEEEAAEAGRSGAKEQDGVDGYAVAIEKRGILPASEDQSYSGPDFFATQTM